MNSADGPAWTPGQPQPWPFQGHQHHPATSPSPEGVTKPCAQGGGYRRPSGSSSACGAARGTCHAAPPQGGWAGQVSAVLSDGHRDVTGSCVPPSMLPRRASRLPLARPPQHIQPPLPSPWSLVFRQQHKSPSVSVARQGEPAAGLPGHGQEQSSPLPWERAREEDRRGPRAVRHRWGRDQPCSPGPRADGDPPDSQRGGKRSGPYPRLRERGGGRARAADRTPGGSRAGGARRAPGPGAASACTAGCSSR